MPPLKSELTMTIVKDSLQKAYADDGIRAESEDEDTFYHEDSDESVGPDDGKKEVKFHHVVEVDKEFRGKTSDHLDPDPKVKHYMGKHYIGGNNDEKESVDPDDGEKEVKVRHVVEEDGEFRGETSDHLDPDDPKLKHHMGGNITYEDSDESVDPDDGEKVVKVLHVVEVGGELRGETFSHLDPDDPKVKRYMGNMGNLWGNNDEKEGNEEDSAESEYDPEMDELSSGELMRAAAEADDPSEESSEESFDSRQNRDQEAGELNGLPLIDKKYLPLVDKKQLEEKALQILNRKLGSRYNEDHKHVSTKSERIERIDRKIESSKTTRERIPNSILTISNLNSDHINQKVSKMLNFPVCIYFLAGHVEFGRLSKGKVFASGGSGDPLPGAFPSFPKSADP